MSGRSPTFVASKIIDPDIWYSHCSVVLNETFAVKPLTLGSYTKGVGEGINECQVPKPVDLRHRSTDLKCNKRFEFQPWGNDL